MPADEIRGPTSMRHRHIDPRPPVRPNLPKGRRRPVAQDCVGSRSKYSRHPASLSGDNQMPDCIDTPMKPVQTPDRKSMLDLILPQPDSEQLPLGHHAVLPAGELGDPVVAFASPPRTGTIPGFGGLAGHAAEGGGRGRARGARFVSFLRLKCRERVTYGPGVRSTAASAVAASASRVAAPSRALDSART